MSTPRLLAGLAGLAVAMSMSVGPQAAHASAITVPQALAIADAAWPGHACTGQVHVTTDPALRARGLDGVATGIVFWPDGRKVLSSCTIALAAGLDLDASRQCDVIVHEVGHLAGHDHDEGGVMAADTGAWPACQPPVPRVTRRVRAVDAVRAALPPGAWRVACDGVVRRCWAVSVGARRRCYLMTIAAGGDAATPDSCRRRQSSFRRAAPRKS